MKKQKLIRRPFNYYGGKVRMAPKIIPYMPPHTVYVEPFCGAAAVLFRKGRPPIANTRYCEVINDLESTVVRIFRALRDHGSEFKRRALLMPYSSEEKARAFEAVYKGRECKDEIEWCVYAMFGYCAAFGGKPMGGSM